MPAAGSSWSRAHFRTSGRENAAGPAGGNCPSSAIPGCVLCRHKRSVPSATPPLLFYGCRRKTRSTTAPARRLNRRRQLAEGAPHAISYAVFCLKKKKTEIAAKQEDNLLHFAYAINLGTTLWKSWGKWLAHPKNGPARFQAAAIQSPHYNDGVP